MRVFDELCPVGPLWTVDWSRIHETFAWIRRFGSASWRPMWTWCCWPKADILGRICSDTDVVLDNIELFREYCADLSVLDEPWAFASDHARFMYFRTPGRDPRYAAYDDTRCTLTVLSGLPVRARTPGSARTRGSSR